MSQRNTLLRSLHDVGLAAWFGGALMGAVGLNGGTAKAAEPSERLRLSSIGWGRWAPVQLTAIIAHGIGGVGLILGNKTRLVKQPEARANTELKLGITAFALIATGYSAILGAKMAARAEEGGAGVTEPGAAASRKLASAQRQQRVVQWLIPLATGALLILGAQQGEQQRPVAGFLQSLLHR